MVGVDPKKVLGAVGKWWTKGARVPNRKSLFGDGNATIKIVEILQKAGYC
jgi:UDP-N-acetylglucosamine 2-epimerase